MLLVLALVFDGLLEGLFDGVGALEGLFDGLLSLPVIAGFVSMLGFGGAIVLGTTGLGTGVAAVVGASAGVGAGWLTWRLSRALMREEPGTSPRGTDLVGTSGSVVTEQMHAGPSPRYGAQQTGTAWRPVHERTGNTTHRRGRKYTNTAGPGRARQATAERRGGSGGGRGREGDAAAGAAGEAWLRHARGPPGGTRR
ncbi:hypothetical protein [Streptomyces sp. NRRL F-3307]|uniref:hypothetical protein n=1 Tax=Streptomyces TaxID=1883 RepID=UPI003B63E29A